MKENLDLLKLEASKDIWSYRSLGGVPLYLLIRSRLLQSMIDDRFNLSNPHLLTRLSIQDKLGYAIKSLINNPFRLKKTPVIIFSSGVVNSESKKGFFYNRLYEYFLESNPGQISIVETSNKFSFNEPKKSKVFYRDSLDILVRLVSLLPLVGKNEKKIALSFIEQLQRVGVSNATSYVQSLNRGLAKYKAGYYVYRFFLQVKKPKLIIVEDASYGGLSYLVKAATSLGIQVAEYQHGYIGLNHPAYNLNCDNLPKDIDQFLPNLFLTHGDYWSQQCRIAAKKITIGYPDLNNRLNSYIQQTNEVHSTSKILFISGGTIPEKLVAFIKSFVMLNPSFKVTLRPHPSERPEMQQRYNELLKLNVQLDTADLYQTLSKADIIVGFEVSTVLYESIFFTNKIYLVDDDYANFYEPSSPFLRFDSPENLLSQIESKSLLDISPDYFWAKDSEKRFTDFLQSQLKG